MAKAKRAALYVRVSTDSQTVENQIRELWQVAERRGWEVVEVYNDAGISGAKGRNGRPGLDSMLKDASRRRFDVAMAWAIDRLGRSLTDLLHIIQHLEACGVDLYLDQQSIDTTTPMGKLVFQVTGAFAEFERTMISTTLADLFTLLFAANPFSAAGASLWRWSSDEFEDGLAHGGQCRSRRRPVDSFFSRLAVLSRRYWRKA
jgi:Resolvase, N terminal domain